jgi:myo-inositol-1(or 4)-monophosphatase
LAPLPLTDSDWIELFAAVAAEVRAAVAPIIGTEVGREEISTGAGGDRTVEIDRLAEEIGLAAFSRAATGGATFSVLSEEVGHRPFGANYPLVVMDPIDGSLNAKQGVPCYAVMLSLLEGPHIKDLRAGYVLNLVSGDEFTAIRGGGASHNGEPLLPLPRLAADRIEVLALESSPRSLFEAERLVRRATKLRVLGSMAISIAHAATGGFDVFCSPIRARVFDMTAGLLLVKEVGGVATDMQGRPLEGLEVGFAVRTTLLASADPAAHRLALEILSGD